MTRCNPVRRDEIRAARRGMESRLRAWLEQANTYLQEHPRAKVATQLRHGRARLKRGKLNAWLRLVAAERSLELVADDQALAEHSSATN